MNKCSNCQSKRNLFKVEKSSNNVTYLCINCIDKNCYTNCEMCKTFVKKNNSYLIYVNDGTIKHLCNKHSEKYNICEVCGRTFEKDTSWCRCYNCRFIKNIHDYVYKPTPIIK